MSATAAELIGAATAVLLDFDGPVTPLMPRPRNAQAAEAARRPLVNAGLELPEAVTATTDHLAVLRYAAPLHPELLAAVEAACIEAEVAAAGASLPTPGAHDFLARCQREDKPVVIVSNNAADAVHTYLLRFQLHGFVRGVVGRQLHRPDLMKPHPSLVGASVEIAGHSPTMCVMIGDSQSDIRAAHASGVLALGYGKTPKRHAELQDARADAVFDSWPDLL